MTGPQGDIFSDLHTAEYDAIMDKILITRHGLAPVDPDMATEEDSTYADMAIYAYLTERAIYIRQNLAYEEAEYNPIENYSQIEHETTDVTYGERDETDTHTDDAHEYSIEHDYQLHTQETHTPEIITESYTEADVVSEQTQLTSTTLNQAVPFESSDLFDMDKTSETPGKITNTEKPYNRKNKTPENTISVNDLAHKDTDTYKHEEDEVHTDRHQTEEVTDGTVRDLTRSGNIGVQTAAQMMQLDSDFWKNNLWLRQLCLDIVNLICERTVLAL